jgi:hypothetical protein
MRQQLLDPVGSESVEGVVGRLGAVADSATELAIGRGVATLVDRPLRATVRPV